MRYSQYKAVTESDSADLPWGGVDALFIGATGNLVVQDLSGIECTFPNVPVGVFPIAAKRLMTASTVGSVVAMKQ